MDNWGENTSLSQFMILPTKFESMDGEYVAFGKVVKGLNLMKCIAEKVATENGIPSKPLVIADCGQIFPKSEGLVPMTTMGAFVILMFGVLLFFLRLDFHFGVWFSLEV
ncbi:unnamed protein product [Arabis nemorensis]|uniref:PPIase cyclophilin-type domain-containing protein n=1 Tax=Arabis nemorensis TaxID=586526 RepID=A0A565AX98_9BRAS|nr:unnamed protein product [Arabis nemorensis]